MLYRARKTGRCANGAERDGGRVLHWVELPSDKASSWSKALCGTKPGGRGNGWSVVHLVSGSDMCRNCAATYSRLVETQPMITGVAIIMPDGKLYSLPAPCRHHHVIELIANTGLYQTPIRGEQGFMTRENEFVDRITGAHLALTSGQTKELKTPPKLYSEDLW